MSQYPSKLRHWMKKAATPPWADLVIIGQFYLEARRLTETTGIRHSVDHIVPLKNPYVCGLHVPHNLRVIVFRKNSKKGNRVDAALALNVECEVVEREKSDDMRKQLLLLEWLETVIL